MNYSTIPIAQTIIGHCKVNDLRNIVISPGSRNAPLTLSFTNDSFFSCFSIVDERCAAFFALGMAQQLKKPVALLCTSGSALLNYYPAIAEAFYSEIPLVVISADRPAYKIDIGDGQTIRQDHVYTRQIGYSANLKQDLTHATKRILKYRPSWLEGDSLKNLQKEVDTFNRKELSQALTIALNYKLPVHINVPLEEPLYEEKEICLKLPEPIPKDTEGSLDLGEEILNIWGRSKQKMVLVGVNSPEELDWEILEKLGNDPSVIVFTETTSNLHHPNFFNSIDSILAPIELNSDRNSLFESLKPEVLVTFGGHIVSKKIKAFLREYSPKYHFHVGNTKPNDTFFCLNESLKISAHDFFSVMYRISHKDSSSYFKKWNETRKKYQVKRSEYLEQIPFSDFLVFDKLLKTIPKYYQLHLANSSTIRYSQLFELDSSLKVFCNRGTSGIDGSTSTAIGGAVYDENPTLLVTGDLSFFYDSNALWNDYLRKDFRIILINNGGGGIFRILPGRKDNSLYEQFFETKHDLNAQNLCQMFDIEYNCSNDSISLENKLSCFYEKSDKPKLLEIFTPRLINDKILTDYFHFIS